MKLTAHQEAAYKSLLDFAQGWTQSGIACLEGYAGTGKTFLVSKLVREMERTGFMKIAVAAPTHQALAVLAEKIGAPVTLLTLHALLGYQMTAHEGTKTALRTRPPSIAAFDLVVVDEASMINDVFFTDLLNHRHAARILFVGDPAQLPPVGEARRSPVFTRVQFRVTLSEVVRQAAENPIIALSGAVRAFFERGEYPSVTALLNAVPAGARSVGACPREWLVPWAIDEHQDGRDCRILAYTNQRVLQLNADLHEALHGATPTPFVAGERVIVHEARDSVRSAGARVTLRTSEELLVSEARQEYADLHLTLERDGAAAVQGIWFDPAKQAETRRRFDEAKAIADPRERGQAFRQAFAYRESFLDLRHAYAMTVHKAQGSTFDTALIDLPDLRRMPPAEFNQALYVAITRPREFLGIGI